MRLPDTVPGKFPDGYNYDHATDGFFYWKEIPKDATGPEDPACRWRLSLGDYTLGNLDAHDVEEHEDGTITVSPSILVTGPNRPRRHGFLRRGVWEPCGDDGRLDK